MACSKRGETSRFSPMPIYPRLSKNRSSFSPQSARETMWPSARRAVDRTLIAVHQSRFREIAGIIFNGFVRLITGLPLSRYAVRI